MIGYIHASYIIFETYNFTHQFRIEEVVRLIGNQIHIFEHEFLMIVNHKRILERQL